MIDAAVRKLIRLTGGFTVACGGGRTEQALREFIRTVPVLSPDTESVDVTAQITPEADYDETAVLAAVRQALRDYFNGTLLGKPVLRAKLGSIIYGVEGVANYALTAPAADVPGAPDLLPMLGILRITKAG